MSRFYGVTLRIKETGEDVVVVVGGNTRRSAERAAVARKRRGEVESAAARSKASRLTTSSSSSQSSPPKEPHEDRTRTMKGKLVSCHDHDCVRVGDAKASCTCVNTDGVPVVLCERHFGLAVDKIGDFVVLSVDADAAVDADGTECTECEWEDNYGEDDE